MEIFLASKDKYNEIARYNLDTEAISIHSRADIEQQNLSTQGVFNIHDSMVVCFFRVGESLFFRLSQNMLEFQKDDRVSLKALPDNIFIFSIKRNNENIFFLQI